MDQPFLALTRRKPAPAGPSAETTTSENMRQLMELRWIAVAGQLVTILVARFGLGVQLPLALMLLLVGVLALANLGVAYRLARRIEAGERILFALLFDVAVLTAQLWLSGGASNPFISLYLLQVVLGAVLLETRSVWILVGVTSLCYAGLTQFSLPLVYPAQTLFDVAALYRGGAWVTFALTGALLTLFITRISRNLRTRETYLAELRRYAVEEDAIIRMGLFASGAAHELGTPLASLSVILNDWRRIPQVAEDAVLTEDLGVMEAEVQRCNVIVSNILDSAGQPRGEAISSMAACRMIEHLTAAWRSTHPKTALEAYYDGPQNAIAVSNPSLRQALWNLLDNAAEVSPQRMKLQASADDDELVLRVLDDGPGFAPEQLVAIGRPQPSMKGPGHGVGLFLAATAARKLGGRLEATNRPEGGADVRLIVPLASPLTKQG